MAVSKAKMASNARWDKENMSYLRCKVRNDFGDAFRLYAEERGRTIHGLLKDYLDGALQADAQEKGYASMDQYIYDMSTEYRSRHPKD